MVPRDTPDPDDHEWDTPLDASCEPVAGRRYSDGVSSPDSRRSGPGRRGRDRHGRGLRGRLVPASAPLSRTRAEIFDDLVLDTVEELEQRFAKELAGVEFAVEDVPPDLNAYASDAPDDGREPLA